MTVYLVRGPLRYRDHDVGELFETQLDPDAEARAIHHGIVIVIDPERTEIRPGSYRLPDGWNEPDPRPERAVSFEGSIR